MEPIVETSSREDTRKRIASQLLSFVAWVVSLQLLILGLNTLRAESLSEVTLYLKAVYPLMTKFNTLLVFPPLMIVIISYFKKGGGPDS
jgi:hypothetical protein